MMFRNRQTGIGVLSALVAVMVVVALSWIVYLYVMPHYRAKEMQKLVAEVLSSANHCKGQVSQVVQMATVPRLTPSLFACDGGLAAGIKISPHLKSIAVSATGVITATLDFRSLPELTPATNVLTLVPLAEANTALRVSDTGKPIYAWRCGSPLDGTTIAEQYLPLGCRG